MMMKNFLGPTQDQLDEDTDYFEQALDIGQSYMESGHWSAAIPFLSTAHDMASAQIKGQKPDLVDVMYDFCTVSVLLILAYKKLTLITEAFGIYLNAIETVENLEVPRKELKAECIENINYQFPDPQMSLRKPSKRIMAH